MATQFSAFHLSSKLKAPFSRMQRARRMDLFLKTMKIRGGEKIIDLGGVDVFWKDCPYPLEITIINLPGSEFRKDPDTIHKLTYVEGDACNMPFFADKSFDIAFSNSVIEHVGPVDKQEAFAREVKRLAPHFWVQTPSIWFPIEAHTHMPLWWAYPETLKAHFMKQWKSRLPAWAEMIEGTTVILRSELARMFPNGAFWTERFAGFPKSYVIYNAASDQRS
jgi:hypothetical protein